MEATAGGTRKHLWYLATRADTSRFDVTVICSTLRDPSFQKDIERFRRRGIHVEIIQMRDHVAPVLDIASIVRMYRLMRAGRFDIVHCHSSMAGYIGRLAAKLAGVPCIVYSPHSFSFYRGIYGVNKLYLMAERMLAKFTDRIVAVSEGERQIALSYGICPPGRIVTVHNGIDPEECTAGTGGEALKRELGIERGAPVVGMIARVSPQKGCEHFFEAASRVQRSIPRAVFILAGQGADRERAAPLLGRLGDSRNMIVAGYRRDIMSVYAIMDVFVLTSLWEGLPYVVLEAMLMEKPVVASRIPGTAELVREAETGYLVEPGDAAGFAARIIELLDDRSGAAEMGRAGRREILRRFEIDRQIDALEGLYTEWTEQ